MGYARNMDKNVSLVIQAGGDSRRMGEDKALKLFLGKPLILWVMDRLASIAGEVLVTTNHPENYTFLNLRLVPDLTPGCGALGGLFTAIASATYPFAAVVACDMPFASEALFKKEIDLIKKKNVDVVIPSSAGGLEPLHAVYRCDTCLPVIRIALKNNQLKIVDWLQKLNVYKMDTVEIRAIESSEHVFRNINTPEDFCEAEQIVKLK
jgi:molybdopterin-guanine dinucleotide biosynthesis protein A